MKCRHNKGVCLVLLYLLFAGCGEGEQSTKQSADIVTEVTDPRESSQEEAFQNTLKTILEAGSEETEEEPTPDLEPAKLGEPRSSYGIGSAQYLWGKNILVSVFVETPDSSFTEEDEQQALAKIKTAVAYIEAQAESYGIEAELVYDWSSDSNLKIQETVEFAINEDSHFWRRLDRQIEQWFSRDISYEDMLAKYDAQGIATMVFVNNEGVSYSNVYDGTGSVQESLVLFAGDYYRPGVPETATTYAHEILHMFGAHDLYKDAEYTEEVTDYIKEHYPHEIMYSVSGSEGADPIKNIISPITAYHLGWVDEMEELALFPQLDRM